MNNPPLVSVICLCYNHERFVKETLHSVFQQSYPNIELIVVDDASTDGSKNVITDILGNRPAKFIHLNANIGNTSAFNRGFSKAKGKYIIDLAADDLLLPDRIEKQVSFFEKCDQKVGVIYSDSIYIDEFGNELDVHFSNKKLIPFSGDIYEKVISTYFISPPTMMMKREVLLELGGYDEQLAYEDFDFWIRSSRNWEYQYQHEVLTKVRRTHGSLSTMAYTKNDQQLYSTYLVCQKIKDLNQTAAEQFALVVRLKYEIRHAVFSGNFKEGKLFIDLLKELEGLSIQFHLISVLNDLQIDLSFFRKIYQKLAH